MTRLEPLGQAQAPSLKLEQGIKLTTFIPVRFVRHKARKVVVEPPSPGRLASPRQPGQYPMCDEVLMRALARGLFWQELLDSGRVASIAEIAAQEGVEKVRVQKMLRLARLVPEVVEEIARGRQAVGLSLERFMRKPIPDDWEAQRAAFAELAC